MGFTLINARLPAWIVPQGWPTSESSAIALAQIQIDDGVITSVVPSGDVPTYSDVIDLAGRLVMPWLTDAHVHLDKTYTRQRLGNVEPGLLSAIKAMKQDHAHWNADDLRRRSHKAFARAIRHGVQRIRTHIDWVDATPPLAWSIIDETSHQFAKFITLERVALMPLTLLANRATAREIIETVHQSHHGIMGAFIHSSNFDPQAMQILLEESSLAGVDLDLHIDEELAAINGLRFLANWLTEHNFSGSITCGHACGLSQIDSAEAQQILAILSQHQVNVVSLPATNLLLQDATPKRTPRTRGLTLVKEIRANGIPVMFASDNVCDAFCPMGDYNPLEALKLAVYTAQLNEAFDVWSSSICDVKYLAHSDHSGLIGHAANLLIFATNDHYCWPESAGITRMHQGIWLENMPEIYSI